MIPVLASVVGGGRREGDTVAADVNPAAPEEHVATVSLAGPGIAADAIEAAASAFAAWRETPPPPRGDVLRRAADLVDARADTIGRDLAREEGKTLAEAIGETRRAATILRYSAGQTLEQDGETYPSHSPLTFLYARREPLGVVTASRPAYSSSVAARSPATRSSRTTESRPSPSRFRRLQLQRASDDVRAASTPGSPTASSTSGRRRARRVRATRRARRALRAPLDEATKVGQLASQSQLDTVSGYLDLAEREAARVLAGGGRRDGGGYFVEPTVLADLPATSRVVREEIFGPVVALLPASSYEEAVVLANDTPFGLTAALFTRDLGKALCFSRDVRAGVVKVNQESAGLEFQVPFGGKRESSSDSREQGKVAREFFTQWKTVYLDAPVA